jgi:hypothetical protein
MLVVTQKEDAWITIEPVDGVDLSVTLRDAFAHGPILVKLMHVGQRRVRLGIQAPTSFKVMRGRSPSGVSADTQNTGAAAAVGERP